MKILWNYYRMIELSITDSAKKKLVKTDILGLRYKQFSGGGVKKIFFQKRKKHDFFNFWNLDVSKMDWNNGFNSSFFVGFPNNPNLDVSGHFGCKFFFWWLPLSAKAVSIYRLTGSRELRNFQTLKMLSVWWRINAIIVAHGDIKERQKDPVVCREKSYWNPFHVLLKWWWISGIQTQGLEEFSKIIPKK